MSITIYFHIYDAKPHELSKTCAIPMLQAGQSNRRKYAKIYECVDLQEYVASISQRNPANIANCDVLRLQECTPWNAEWASFSA